MTDNAMNVDLPDVDVVIPVYDDQRLLDAIVMALDHQVDLSGAQLDRVTIAVADDASPRPPRPPASRHPLQVVRHDVTGYHPSSARNLGARQGTSRIVVFLDGDTVPAPDYIARLVQPIRDGSADLTTGHRRHADFTDLTPTDIAASVRNGSTERLLGEPTWLADGLARTNQLRDGSPRVYEYVISATLAVRRDLFDAVGGFDESFDTYGGEDWELAYRCWNIGGRFEHVPSAIAVHDGPDIEGRDIDADAKVIESSRIADLVATSPTRLRGIRYTVPRIDIELDVTTASSIANLTCVWSLLSSTISDLRIRLVGPADDVVTVLDRCSDERLTADVQPDPRIPCRVLLHGPTVFAPHSLDALTAEVVAGTSQGRSVRVDHREVMRVISVRHESPFGAIDDSPLDRVDGESLGMTTTTPTDLAAWARRRRADSESDS